MLQCMASYYVRKGSPYYWLRYQHPDGTWGDRSSKIRTDGPGAVRKIKQRTAELTMQEVHRDRTGSANGFDTWVPGFLGERYRNPKTLARYMAAWSAVATYLAHIDIVSPLQVSYRLCTEYPQFRTKPPTDAIRARSYNTALTELKVFSAILQEAVRRGYITANPCIRLGMRRTPPKRKPEITAAEQTKIESALRSQDEWMRDSWTVAMLQGCRISETAVPMSNVDSRQGVISFLAKGGRIHTAPLHSDLLPLVRRAKKQRRTRLVALPQYAPKKWHQFFRRLGLAHLSFHATRVTVVTRLARAGFSMAQTKAYVGHASDTVHSIYQRLAPTDVRHLGAVLSSQTA
jgi:integrase